MRNLPDTTELKKEGPVLTLSLSDSEACVLCLPQPELHVQEAQVILHGRTQESGTPTQASCCRVEPQARSWEGQDPGVKVLRHSGPQVQSLQTVVEPPAGTPPPRAQSTPSFLWPSVIGEPAGLGTMQGSVAGRRKEGR